VSSKSSNTNWRDKLKQARLPEAVVEIVLRGDLAVEHEQLTRQLEDIKSRPATSLAGSGAGPVEERLFELANEMRESVLAFTLRALPRGKRPGDRRPSWRELREQYPPREKNGEIVREDILAGFVNAADFPEPLVKASVVDPELTDDDWADLMPSITDGQFDELVNAAWNLNRGKVDIPFSSAGSETTPTSGVE
jgi:hypothetical protein